MYIHLFASGIFCLTCLYLVFYVMPFSGSLGGAADLKLLGVRSELSNSRHSWLVIPCKMKCSRLELCVGLKGVQAVHGPTIAGFDTRSGRLSNALVVSCLVDGSVSFFDTQCVIVL